MIVTSLRQRQACYENLEQISNSGTVNSKTRAFPEVNAHFVTVWKTRFCRGEHWVGDEYYNGHDAANSRYYCEFCVKTVV